MGTTALQCRTAPQGLVPLTHDKVRNTPTQALFTIQTTKHCVLQAHGLHSFIPLLSPTEKTWLNSNLAITPLFSLQWRARNFSQKLFNLRKKSFWQDSSHKVPLDWSSTCFKLFPAITLLFMLIAAYSSLFSGVFKRGCCYRKGSFWRRCHLLHSLPHSSQLFRCHSNWLLLRDRKFTAVWSFAWGYSSVLRSLKMVENIYRSGVTSCSVRCCSQLCEAQAVTSQVWRPLCLLHHSNSCHLPPVP